MLKSPKIVVIVEPTASSRKAVSWKTNSIKSMTSFSISINTYHILLRDVIYFFIVFHTKKFHFILYFLAHRCLEALIESLLKKTIVVFLKIQTQKSE